MQVNVKQFLEESGITEAFYPGKKLVHSCRQPGEYKSHCVVLDWRDPSKIRIEVKAGLSGKDLEPSKLKYYPVSFQTPTYVDIEVVNDNDDKEDEEEKGKGTSGKGGSGSKKPGKKLDEVKLMAASAFGDVVEGKFPSLAKSLRWLFWAHKLRPKHTATSWANSPTASPMRKFQPPICWPRPESS